MRKRKKHNLELVGDNEKIVLKLQESVKEMEKNLKRMGIERPHRGPRISDPAHTRDVIDSYLSSSIQRGDRL